MFKKKEGEGELKHHWISESCGSGSGHLLLCSFSSKPDCWTPTDESFERARNRSGSAALQSRRDPNRPTRSSCPWVWWIWGASRLSPSLPSVKGRRCCPRVSGRTPSSWFERPSASLSPRICHLSAQRTPRGIGPIPPRGSGSPPVGSRATFETPSTPFPSGPWLNPSLLDHKWELKLRIFLKKK